ncbi:MAG TPA: 2-amino-4-hydroxy-6-hydroxymethyldihydropteridine diphosphokinase [Chitinophagales bacterium]|nr:2-amino-4-hydroxy-6-hydroxymethyldihydropteridine diphosphokinase [Chitinophagales bacterium]
MKAEKRHAVYLLFGSNLGDRVLHVQSAMKSVHEQIGEAQKKSSIYETEPWGVSDQPNYLNAAMSILTNHSPQQLLTLLKQIEIDEGRTDQKKYASRTLDIDILFYEDLILQTDSLIIPHPKLKERRFALVPLLEIAHDFIHPVIKKSIAQLLEECNDHLSVTKLVQQ